VSLVAALLALFTDPSYGLPLVATLVLAIVLGWWALRRSAPLPSLAPEIGPESWRFQLDALVYSDLKRGRYAAAVDGLGRCLSVTLRDRYRIRLSEPTELDDPEANRHLAPPMSLRTLVKDLNRAYTSATWAEQSNWIADRWGWLRRRQQRRAARDFAILTHRMTRALDALEAA